MTDAFFLHLKNHEKQNPRKQQYKFKELFCIA